MAERNVMADDTRLKKIEEVHKCFQRLTVAEKAFRDDPHNNLLQQLQSGTGKGALDPAVLTYVDLLDGQLQEKYVKRNEALDAALRTFQIEINRAIGSGYTHRSVLQHPRPGPVADHPERSTPTAQPLGDALSPGTRSINGTESGNQIDPSVQKRKATEGEAGSPSIAKRQRSNAYISGAIETLGSAGRLLPDVSMVAPSLRAKSFVELDWDVDGGPICKYRNKYFVYRCMNHSPCITFDDIKTAKEHIIRAHGMIGSAKNVRQFCAFEILDCTGKDVEAYNGNVGDRDDAYPGRGSAKARPRSKPGPKKGYKKNVLAKKANKSPEGKGSTSKQGSCAPTSNKNPLAAEINNHILIEDDDEETGCGDPIRVSGSANHGLQGPSIDEADLPLNEASDHRKKGKGKGTLEEAPRCTQSPSCTPGAPDTDAGVASRANGWERASKPTTEMSSATTSSPRTAKRSKRLFVTFAGGKCSRDKTPVQPFASMAAASNQASCVVPDMGCPHNLSKRANVASSPQTRKTHVGTSVTTPSPAPPELGTHRDALSKESNQMTSGGSPQAANPRTSNTRNRESATFSADTSSPSSLTCDPCKAHFETLSHLQRHRATAHPGQKHAGQKSPSKA